jgi:formylglycine-generating enzyme required for sulfatase activity
MEASAKTKMIENSIGMKFALIHSGEFLIGSDEFDSEKPVHKVKIKMPFYFGIYPVTQRNWFAIMGNNPSYFKGDNLPVESVSWNDAQDFIKKLNEKEYTINYRLPSEAERKYAARAGTTTKYSFGDDEIMLGKYAWYSVNSNGTTHHVGKKEPNPWGLYDMHGNVWEWVQDKWHDNYCNAPTGGSAWEDESCCERVIKGGRWNSRAISRRSAFRRNVAPDSRYCSLGFRVLRIL